jgi:hypothetical protein
MVEGSPGSTFLDMQESPADSASTAPILWKPFAATKYERTLKILANGSSVTTSDRHDVKVARDESGRIRVDAPAECCVDREVVVFDPANHLITPWLEGGNGAHQATQITLTQSQIEDAEASQRPQQTVPDEFSVSQHNDVVEEDLGEAVIEGVPVTATRMTVVRGGVTMTRKVWTSREMQLVMKVVVKESGVQERVVGLEKVSLSPDPALFLPPTNYLINSNKEGRFPEWSLEQIANAVVK